MRSFWKSALLLLSMAASVSAQNYPYPGAVPDPPVICTGCPGTNSVAEPNDGKLTAPYDTPLSLHAGRFVDASNAPNVQAPFRTIRSGLVRVAPAARNRIYLALGGAVGAYTFDTFFSGKLTQPMEPENTVFPGGTSGRTVIEKVTRPDRYFYAEGPSSGWSTPQMDVQEVLTDFDADDRGDLYIATIFGWGIASDPGGTDGSHLPFVAQVSADNDAVVLFSMRNGASYYVYHSNAIDSAKIYDVTTAASPVSGGVRTGSTKTFKAWSKYETGQRVALINLDGHARIYTYADLIANAAPLADLTPTAGKFFADLSFDDDGNLWLAESTNSTTNNLLRKATPSGGTYTTTTFDVYGVAAFSPRKIHAAGGSIAVAGQIAGASDLRLLKVVAGSPVLQDTGGFFEKYYHRTPSGYARPVFSDPRSVRLVVQGAKTYLFYNAWGLGDVYQLGDGPRITSIAPLSGIPAGGTTVDLYGSGFTASATVTFGGLTASSSFLSASHMTAVSPVHAAGPVDVVVTVPSQTPMTAPRQFTYMLTAPQNVAANATSTSSITVTWDAVAGATQYEVSRRLPAGTWTVISTPAVTTFIDGGRDAETTYVYRVRAADGAANFSASSAIDLATTMSSQSANIVAGTPVLAIDFTTLRSRVNALRAAAGLSAYSFTGAISGVVLAQHMNELRTALTQGRTSLGLTTPVFTNPSDVTGATIKAVHLNELLDLMK